MLSSVSLQGLTDILSWFNPCARLLKLDSADRERKRIGESRNALESFIFTTRDALESAMVMEVSTEEAREEVAAMLSQVIVCFPFGRCRPFFLSSFPCFM